MNIYTVQHFLCISVQHINYKSSCEGVVLRAQIATLKMSGFSQSIWFHR